MSTARRLLAAIAILAGCAPLSPLSTAEARTRPRAYSVELVGDCGTLPTHRARGKTWVEGRWGERYAIRISNHTGQRVEVVVSVDGRDVIDGEVADYRTKRGYLLGPYESYEIRGFRTSYDTVAAFRFTDVRGSYAARRGDSRNVGVVGAAFFPERRRRRPVRPLYKTSRRGEFRGGGADLAPEGDLAEAPRPGAERGAGDDFDLFDGSGRSRGGKSGAKKRRVQDLGTGWGETLHSGVTEVDFERASRRPARVLSVYYDNRAGLRAKGVRVDRGWSCWPESPRPFATAP